MGAISSITISRACRSASGPPVQQRLLGARRADHRRRHGAQGDAHPVRPAVAEGDAHRHRDLGDGLGLALPQAQEGAAHARAPRDAHAEDQLVAGEHRSARPGEELGDGHLAPRRHRHQLHHRVGGVERGHGVRGRRCVGQVAAERPAVPDLRPAHHRARRGQGGREARHRRRRHHLGVGGGGADPEVVAALLDAVQLLAPRSRRTARRGRRLPSLASTRMSVPPASGRISSGRWARISIASSSVRGRNERGRRRGRLRHRLAPPAAATSRPGPRRRRSSCTRCTGRGCRRARAGWRRRRPSGSRSSSALAASTIPGMQMPHCTPPLSMKASCSGMQPAVVERGPRWSPPRVPSAW